jgi:small subunit ribosomal protein S2
MLQPNLEQLLEAGVHFGHQTRRWNPKMRRFIFAERNGIHIIDLQKTLRQLELAQKLAREVILRGENVLFVCTKRQLSAIVQAEAERCGAMFVTERWLGGLMTNFQTVKKQTRRLKELEAGSEEGGEFSNYTKKEQLMMSRQRDKLSKNLSGIKNMTRLPGLMFVIDSKKERIAVSEANKLGIPLIAIVDTNADPDLITVPIAGNDDAIRSVELMTKAIADAILEARREAPAAREQAEEGEESTYSSERGVERAPGDRGDRGPSAGGGSAEDARKRRPRRRRAKPEAIAARLRTGTEGEAAPEAPEAEAEASDEATPE